MQLGPGEMAPLNGERKSKISGEITANHPTPAMILFRTLTAAKNSLSTESFPVRRGGG